MLDRRRGVLARNDVQRGDGSPQAREKPLAADLRDRSRPRRRRKSPARALPRQHRAGRVAGAPAPLLRSRRARISSQQGDPGDGGVRAAEHHHGSALHEARHLVVPQPAHLPVERAPATAHPTFSLQHEPGGHSVSGQRGDDRHLLRAVLDARRQGTALQEDRSTGRHRHRRVSVGDGGPEAGFLGCRRRGFGARPGVHVAKPANARRSRARAAIFARGHPLQRQGRRPLRQRAGREVFRAGRRKGEPQRLRHGARGAPLRALARVRRRAPRFGNGLGRGREGRDQRRQADRRFRGWRSSPSRGSSGER